MKNITLAHVVDLVLWVLCIWGMTWGLQLSGFEGNSRTAAVVIMIGTAVYSKFNTCMPIYVNAQAFRKELQESA